jgi:hypothetical protein
MICRQFYRSTVRRQREDALPPTADLLIGIAIMGVALTGASGINQKLDKFRSNNNLPKRVVAAAKYLGPIRNAADHGRDTDPDVNAVWKIQPSTALKYVYVSVAHSSQLVTRANKAGIFSSSLRFSSEA